MRSLRRLRGGFTIACCALVAAFLSAAGAAGNSAGFNDETGEPTAGGPDIARVEASNDDAGNVTFRILLANGASLAANQGIWLSLDTDENPATGGYIMGVGRGGFDYPQRPRRFHGARPGLAHVLLPGAGCRRLQDQPLRPGRVERRQSRRGRRGL